MKYIFNIIILLVFLPVGKVEASSGSFTIERTRSVSTEILLVSKIDVYSYLELIESSDPDDQGQLVMYSEIYTFQIERIIDTDGVGKLNTGDEINIVIKGIKIERKSLQEMVLNDQRIVNKDVTYSAMNPRMIDDRYIIFINQRKRVESEYGQSPHLYGFLTVDDRDNVLVHNNANDETHFSREFQRLSEDGKVTIDDFETLMLTSPVFMNDKDSYMRSLDNEFQATIRLGR